MNCFLCNKDLTHNMAYVIDEEVLCNTCQMFNIMPIEDEVLWIGIGSENKNKSCINRDPLSREEYAIHLDKYVSNDFNNTHKEHVIDIIYKEYLRKKEIVKLRNNITRENND